jgi:hypothetical protein
VFGVPAVPPAAVPPAPLSFLELELQAMTAGKAKTRNFHCTPKD